MTVGFFLNIYIHIYELSKTAIKKNSSKDHNQTSATLISNIIIDVFVKTNQIIYWKFVKEHQEISLMSDFREKTNQTDLSIQNITFNNSGVIYIVIVIYTGHTYYIYPNCSNARLCSHLFSVGN